ncbi:hypothetical protein [Nitratireductor soli]|uniref:hypothetical protein n=1 Tax=Nitratireductor soli TaxID=1670619 RepID=UPI0009E48343|nr:hypothetical protein [Nitratireductor soli]
MIVPPRRRDNDSDRDPDRDPDRQAECRTALEAEFQSIARRAMGAGWSDSEVEFALLCLAIADIRHRASSRETAEQIRQAIRIVEGR